MKLTLGPAIFSIKSNSSINSLVPSFLWCIAYSTIISMSPPTLILIEDGWLSEIFTNAWSLLVPVLRLFTVFWSVDCSFHVHVSFMYTSLYKLCNRNVYDIRRTWRNSEQSLSLQNLRNCILHPLPAGSSATVTCAALILYQEVSLSHSYKLLPIPTECAQNNLHLINYVSCFSVKLLNSTMFRSWPEAKWATVCAVRNNALKGTHTLLRGYNYTTNQITSQYIADLCP